MATVRRQTQGVRRQARAEQNSRRVRTAKKHTRSVLGRVLALLPFTEDQLRRAFTVLILAGAGAGALFVASISGGLAFASARIERGVADAGFKVEYVEPQNTVRANRAAIYNAVWGDGRDVAMTHVDLEGLRARVLALPWVKDARVSRQWPNGLIVDIVERTPHAVARRADRLMLVDVEGVDLEPVSAADAGGLLLLEGLPDPSRGDAEERARLREQVRYRVAALGALLDAAPALRAQVKSAEWVGNRRWDLTFNSGQELKLPEGEDRASTALIAFAKADGIHRLIGGEVASFDMRNPPRMFLRVPGRAGGEELALGGES